MNFARVLFSSLVGRTRSITRRVLRGDVRVGETRAYILAFTLAVATVGVFLGYHIASSYREEMAYWQARQSSVAEDRAQRVSGWLNERQADAELFSTRPSVRAALQAYHDLGRAAGRPTGGPPSLTPVLDEMARLYGYAGVYVLDRDAHVVAQSSGSWGLSPSLTDICRTVARSGATRISLQDT